LLTNWLGYATDEATWEPLLAMYETNPRQVRQYVNASEPKADRLALLHLLAHADKAPPGPKSADA
jgi:hypothetical protein